MYSVFDDSTRRLFAQLRKGLFNSKAQNFDYLVCPMCSDRLEPLLCDIEMDEKNNLEYQKIWWTCRNAAKCLFPFKVPTNVFWTKRTKDQIREGFIPLPNFHLLPKQFHHFYPNLFKKVTSKSINKISKAITSTYRLDDNAKLLNVLDENKKNENKKEKKHKLIQPSCSEAIESAENLVSINAYRTPAIEFNDEFDSEQVKYGNPDSRRCVELFSDANAALSSNLSLKFSTDAFLNTINSEMSKRQLIKPRPAINQKQRLRLLNCVEKFETSHGSEYSKTIDSIIKKIAKNKKLTNGFNKFESLDSYTKNDLNQNNENESLNCLETSTSSQIMNNDFRVFYPQYENYKFISKKLRDDIEASDEFILAMRIFEESKNTNSLMLRLGLSDADFETSNNSLDNTLLADDSQQCTSLLNKTIEPNSNMNESNVIETFQTQLHESCFSDETLFSNVLINSVSKDNSVISDSLYTSQLSTSPCSATFFDLQNKPSTSTDIQFNNKIKKKKKRKAPELNLPFSFDDPELNNLVKTKYREFMNNVSAERKAKRRKRINEQNDKNSLLQERNEFSGFDSSLSSNFRDHSTTSLLKDHLNQQNNSQIIDEHGFPIDLDDSHYQSTLEMAGIDEHFYNYSNPYGEDDLTFGLDQF